MDAKVLLPNKIRTKEYKGGRVGIITEHCEIGSAENLFPMDRPLVGEWHGLYSLQFTSHHPGSGNGN
jgi:hypothetical protein